jgi:acetyl esterase/lipase
MKKYSLIRILLMAALASGVFACSPFTILNGLAPAAGNDKSLGISYGSDARHELDVYAPKLTTGTAPVVVFFYGGNWRTGSRKDYEFVGKALASRGMVAVIADYRLYPQVRYPEFLEDAAQAVQWTYAHIDSYGGNPEQLFLMGHSAGAYNAAMLALDERWLAEHRLSPSILCGWIGLAGPYNFLPIDNERTKPVFFHPNTPSTSQPINHVDSTSPPALLIAALDDSVVDPIQNTKSMAAKLRKKGVPVESAYFSGIGHSTLIATLVKPLSYFWPTLDMMENFVQACHLTPEPESIAP